MFDPVHLAPHLTRQRYTLISVAAGNGVELCYWQSAFRQPELIDTQGGDRVVFTYQLRGLTRCWTEGGPVNQGEYARETSGSVYFAPGRRGRFHQHGPCESVSVAVHPDVLRGWIGNLDRPLRQSLDSGACFLGGYRGARLHEAAYAISRELKHLPPAAPATTAGIRLLHEGQALLLAGLFLQAGRAGTGLLNRTVTHRQQLLAARDHLLADLAHPPTLAQLATEAGISAIRIKRGFRELFGHSVYGLFQQERMREAQRRLLAGGVTVMEVAFGLGYSNPSHFAAAFRKTFGLAPGEFKRREGFGGGERCP